MIKCLVFTKERPLQFEAFLNSLIFCSGIDENQIHIIAPDERHYKKLIQAYPGLNWYLETWFGGSFAEALKWVLFNRMTENDSILFGCDDIVYTRMFNLRTVEMLMRTLEPAGSIGFSLRLGTNIKGCDSIAEENSIYRMWRWRGKPGHFGYPFELMASVYPVRLVREIFSALKELKTPNHLELGGVQYCRALKSNTNLCMFNTSSYAVAQDVNCVQTFLPNQTHGTEEHTPENLIAAYERGAKIDWSSLFGISPPDAFVGDKYWKVVG
jgi:hypothetical protein